ncbi:MAG: ferrous iron transport protein A [Gemmatimonadetes bacterium]|nr:ferrous iron transport protein A [Gemmatimonadota bacterium]
MAAGYLTCPLCGFEFEKLDTLCAHGCPLGALCNLVRCPSCGFEFPETPRSVSWLRELLRRESPDYSDLPVGVRPVGELESGDRAKVLCLGAKKPTRQNTLAVFGLVPGAEITLLQKRPSCVLRIGETELALDSDIARTVLVQRIGHDETS